MEAAGVCPPRRSVQLSPSREETETGCPGAGKVQGDAPAHWHPGQVGPQGDGHSPARDPAARMVSSVLIGPPGTQPSWPPLRAKHRAGEGGWEALPPWQLAPPGLRAQGSGRGQQGRDQSRGARVQRCLVWVLGNSKSWVGVKGVPFLDAESSSSDEPACLSGLVADSSQGSSVVIGELGGRRGKEDPRCTYSLIREQFGTVSQKPGARACCPSSSIPRGFP